MLPADKGTCSSRSACQYAPDSRAGASDPKPALPKAGAETERVAANLEGDGAPIQRTGAKGRLAALLAAGLVLLLAVGAGLWYYVRDRRHGAGAPKALLQGAARRPRTLSYTRSAGHTSRGYLR